MREEWEQTRIVAGGSLGIAASFSSDWRPAFGWSFGMLHGLLPWLDLALDLESFTHQFDDSNLRSRGATVQPPGTASSGDVALGFHFHASDFGWRWYGAAQAALPDFSRPAVTYTDATGSHTVAGTEIFGFDPGVVLGAGFEKREAAGIGGAIEARLLIAPGRTRPAELLASLRASLNYPLPF